MPKLPAGGKSLLGVAGFLFFCLLGCKGGNGGPAKTEAPRNLGDTTGNVANVASPFTIPEKYADLLGDYRKKWTHLTGYEFSGLHWGQYISLYVNQDPERYVKNYMEYVRLYVNQDIDENDPADSAKHFEPYTVGTVFLKENYLALNAKPGQPASVTVMIKREPGYDAATHDWQFLQFGPAGNILFDGNSQDTPTQAMCIKCHANMAERDFIFSTYCTIAPTQQK